MAPPEKSWRRTPLEITQAFSHYVTVLHMTPSEETSGYAALQKLHLPLGNFTEHDPIQVVRRFPQTLTQYTGSAIIPTQWMEDAFLARKAKAEDPESDGNDYVRRPPPPQTLDAAAFRALDIISGTISSYCSVATSMTLVSAGPLPIKSISRSRDSTIGASPHLAGLDYHTIRQWAFITDKATQTLHICGRVSSSPTSTCRTCPPDFAARPHSCLWRAILRTRTTPDFINAWSEA